MAGVPLDCRERQARRPPCPERIWESRWRGVREAERVSDSPVAKRISESRWRGAREAERISDSQWGVGGGNLAGLSADTLPARDLRMGPAGTDGPQQGASSLMINAGGGQVGGTFGGPDAKVGVGVWVGRTNTGVGPQGTAGGGPVVGPAGAGGSGFGVPDSRPATDAPTAPEPDAPTEDGPPSAPTDPNEDKPIEETEGYDDMIDQEAEKVRDLIDGQGESSETPPGRGNDGGNPPQGGNDGDTPPSKEPEAAAPTGDATLPAPGAGGDPLASPGGIIPRQKLAVDRRGLVARPNPMHEGTTPPSGNMPAPDGGLTVNEFEAPAPSEAQRRQIESQSNPLSGDPRTRHPSPLEEGAPVSGPAPRNGPSGGLLPGRSPGGFRGP